MADTVDTVSAAIRFICDHQSTVDEDPNWSPKYFKAFAARVRSGELLVPNAEEIAVAIESFAKPDVYEALRTMNCEGWFNDNEVTNSDLYAALRSTTYEGRDAKPKQDLVYKRAHERIDQVHRLYKDQVAAICERVSELMETRDPVGGVGKDGRPASPKRTYMYTTDDGEVYTISKRVFEDVLRGCSQIV